MSRVRSAAAPIGPPSPVVQAGALALNAVGEHLRESALREVSASGFGFCGGAVTMAQAHRLMPGTQGPRSPAAAPEFRGPG